MMFLRYFVYSLIGSAVSQSEPLCIEDAEVFFRDLKETFLAAPKVDLVDLCNGTETELKKKEKEIDNIRRSNGELGAENQALRTEKAKLEAELNKLRVVNAELEEASDNLLLQNKKLSDQYAEANLIQKDADLELFELRKLRIQLEGERDSLFAALGDIELTLKEADEKLAFALAAPAQIRTEMENSLRLKDEVIENIRRSSANTIEELHLNLSKVESQYNTEIIHIKDYYEMEINGLKLALEYANKTNSECSMEVTLLRSKVTENNETLTQLEDLLSTVKPNLQKLDLKVSILVEDQHIMDVSSRQMLQEIRYLVNENTNVYAKVSEKFRSVTGSTGS